MRGIFVSMSTNTHSEFLKDKKAGILIVQNLIDYYLDYMESEFTYKSEIGADYYLKVNDLVNRSLDILKRDRKEENSGPVKKINDSPLVEDLKPQKLEDGKHILKVF